MSSHPATFYHYEPLLHFDIKQARHGHLAQVYCHLAQVSCHLVQFNCHLAQVSCHLAQVSFLLAPVSCHLAQVNCRLAQLSCRLAPLKGQCHEIFCFWFFSLISFPLAPEYSSKTVSNFFENSRRYSKLKVCHVANGKNLQSEKF
jgi:hypothetical protein